MVHLQVQEAGASRFPVHHLDLDKVVLSESPLDDYQRLYFANLIDGDDRLFATENATYKSNIAESFANPFQPADDAARYGAKQNVLDCFEYQLPDVSTSKEIYTSEFGKLSETHKRNLQLDRHPTQLLRGTITKDGEVSCDTAHVNDAEESAATLTKNQQFKLRKLDHNLQNNDKLINPNNCILWTKDSGYVFLTGIWRIYQDVMRGLIHTPRQGHPDNDHLLQDACMRSLGMIIDHALYENPKDAVSPTPSGSASDRRKRRSSLGSELNFSSLPSSNSFNPQANSRTSSASSAGSAGSAGTGGSFSNSYTDLHWNNLVPDLKYRMLEMYKSYLVSEKGVLPEEMSDFTITHIVKRIRGGYIKIQGTWLPIDIARLLCARFCFPIRYLLVPIFGEAFPKECEDSFNSIHQQVSDLATTIQPSVSKNQWLDLNANQTTISPINQYAFMPTQKRKKKGEYTLERKRLPPTYVEIPKSNAILNTGIDLKRSSSWAPDSDHLLIRGCSREKLPPISTIMESLSHQRSTITVNDNFNQCQDTKHVNVSPAGRYFTPQQQTFAEPTVQTLSHLATFYTTNGHRYSYPGKVYQSHQKPSPLMDHFQNDYFAPNSNSIIYSPTQELPSLNHIYYDISPVTSQHPIRRSPENLFQPTRDDYVKIPNLSQTENVTYPATNQGPFSASR